ncbi:MAG: TonB-dependent receptor [Chitinophagaceae bacterium]
MKYLVLILLSVCFIQPATAQITGKINSPNGRPLAAASVLLLKNNDSSLIKATISSDSGTYNFDNIKMGTYRIDISSSGYQSWQSSPFSISDSQRTKEFEPIVLAVNSKQLGEVVVRSQKPLFQQKPEGTVVNVENSILSKGSSALQVLERSPGVVINRRDNSIELNGKSGVNVMMNGKPMRMSMEQLVTLLDGMSADDIATIELLTTPPANYDAEGSAGLINIVLKKNKKKGTNGSLSASAGYGYKEKGNITANLSYNKNNLNLYGGYTFSHNSTYSNMHVASSQNMPFLGGDVFVDGWFTSKFLRNSHDANMGIDLKVNATTTVGGLINFNNSRMSGSSFTNAGYNVLPDSLLQFTGLNSGKDRWNNLMNSVYVEKVFRQGSKTNFGFDYLYFNNTDNYYVASSFINKHGMQAGDDKSLFAPGQRGNANTTIKVVVPKIDYSTQLAKNTKLEAGAKAAITRSISASGIESLIDGVWKSNDQTSNHIIMNEGIGAAYAAISSQPGKRISLNIGLRYEYSATKMDNTKTSNTIANRKLGAIFPSLFFSKNLNDQSELQFSYTKRITRPTYNDLASYVGYSDPTAVYTGNPFLKPAITHNLKVGYNFKNYSFSVLASRDINAISRYQLSESPAKDMLLISPQNIDWQNSLTAQATVPLKISNWWTINNSITGWWRNYKVSFSKQPFEKTWLGYSLNVVQTFKLPRDLSIEFGGIYHSLSYDGTKKVNAFGTLSVGIRKDLRGNKGSFQLTVDDILSSEHYFINYGTITEEAYSIRSYVKFFPESARSPIFKLTYSRSFGNSKRIQKRQASSIEENDRIEKN